MRCCVLGRVMPLDSNVDALEDSEPAIQWAGGCTEPREFHSGWVPIYMSDQNPRLRQLSIHPLGDKTSFRKFGRARL